MRLNYKCPEFNDDLGHLVTSIKLSSFKPDLIVGLARGGLVTSVCLSHKLGIEMESINWPREEAGRSNCFYIGDLIQEGKKILFVDDIVDTGRSFESLLEHLQNGQIEDLNEDNYRVAALLWYTDSELFKPDYYGMKIDRSKIDFVDFWWEKK